MSTPIRARPQILFVDDEPLVLESISKLLRKEFDVHLATSGAQALQKMRELPQLAVVISDMRMPSMDGATFLQAALQRCPGATRIMLTGEAGREAAAMAVNKGQIFRFLSKPCPLEELKAAIDDGVAQNRLVNAERSVLQETLVGCIGALMEVLAIANPTAYGRADRIKRLALDLSASLGTQDFWQLESAALLSQIGYLSLPPALVEKVYYGKSLTHEEHVLALGVPAVAIKLLDHIPRLDPVIQILSALTWTDEQLAKLGDGMIGRATRLLGIAIEYDTLTAQGKPRGLAISVLRDRTSRYGTAVIEKLAESVSIAGGEEKSIEVPLRRVVPGMTILQDIRTTTGVLLVPNGFEVSRTFIERISGFEPKLLDEIVRVAAPQVRGAA